MKLDRETKAIIEMIDRRIAELKQLRARFAAMLRKGKR